MAQRLLPAIQQVFSDLGYIGIGYKLKTYATLTTTPLATYSDEGLTTPNANPASGATTGNQISDGDGRFGDMWVSNLSLYKIILTDNNDVPLVTADPVDGGSGNSIIIFNPIPEAFWGTTAGTSTAYTLDSNVDISSIGYQDTQIFKAAYNVTCGAAPTLAISGLPALNLKKYTGQGTKIALQAGDVVGGQTFDHRNDGVDIVVLNPRNQNIYLGTSPTLTISSGAVTITNEGGSYKIDTESAAASDTLDTINGTVSGQVVVLQSVSNARDIIISNGVGNIYTNNGLSETLNYASDRVSFISDGSNLYQLTRSLKDDAKTLAKAWVSFNGTSANPITPSTSFNTSATVTKSATGLYTVTFTVPFASANYTAIISAKSSGSSGAGLTQQVSKLAGSYQFYTTDTSGNASDVPVVELVFFGEQ